MSAVNGPSIVTSGLQIYLDVNNTKSYPNSGTTWTDLANKTVFSTSTYTYPAVAGPSNARYFTFINDGVTQNNICSTYTVPSTHTQTQYTRQAWFYLTGFNLGNQLPWSPIITNERGNNSDMALVVGGTGIIPGDNRLAFHQYTQPILPGNGNTGVQDYNIIGTTLLSLNTWYNGAMTVDHTSHQISLYVNGIFDGAGTTINPNIGVDIGNAYGDRIAIGGCFTDGYSGQRMFKGHIALVAHYNRILTADEIFQNFAAHRGRYGV